MYNYLRSLNKNIKIFFNYVLGPLVFCLLIYSIYRQIQRHPDWRHSLEEIKKAFDSAAALKLKGVLGLMVVNWGIEARKWQLVIRRLQPISFFRSFKATFSGTTLAFFTPNRMQLRNDYWRYLLVRRMKLRFWPFENGIDLNPKSD